MGSTVFFIMVSLPAVTEPGGAVARGRDADGVLHLLGGQTEHPAGGDGRGGGGQGGVVPADLADAREAHLAQPLLELVGQSDPDQKIAARPAGALGGGHGGRDDVRRVRRILLPVDVVVVHHPDHERVEQRCRHGIPAFAGHQYGGVRRIRRIRRAPHGRCGHRAAGRRRARNPRSPSEISWPRSRPRAADLRSSPKRPTRPWCG